MKLIFEGKSWDEIIDQVREFVTETQVAVAGVQTVRPPTPKPEADTSDEQTQPEEASDEAETPDDSEITADDVVKALRGHVKHKGRDSAIAILEKFGAARASAVPADKRAEAVEKLNG